MKHQYHFGSPNYAVLKEVARVSALISDLDRIVRILETDIATEEERAGVSDPFNANYPILARILTARWHNLRETIVALERRLSSQAGKVERLT
jgi:flagellar FliJ protein